MGQFRLSVAEGMLTILFIGLFFWLAVSVWGEYLGAFVPILLVAVLILFLVYLLLLIMIRQHRDGTGSRGPDA